MQTGQWRRLIMVALLSSVLLGLGASHVLARQWVQSPRILPCRQPQGGNQTRRLRGKAAGGAVLLRLRFRQFLNAGSAGLST